MQGGSQSKVADKWRRMTVTLVRWSEIAAMHVSGQQGRGGGVVGLGWGRRSPTGKKEK
jgi:hypothetical protein